MELLEIIIYPKNDLIYLKIFGQNIIFEKGRGYKMRPFQKEKPTLAFENKILPIFKPIVQNEHPKTCTMQVEKMLLYGNDSI